MELDVKKMRGYAHEVFETAKSHGWHEERLSDISYIGLAMTEAAEAVNADRRSLRCSSSHLMHVLGIRNDSLYILNFDKYVKDSVEDEIADIVIRLIDYAYLRWGEDMDWNAFDDECHPNPQGSFVENYYMLTKRVMNTYAGAVCHGIRFCYEWAKQLGIDLDAHIQAKMRYNKLRPYKHGNKKY